jgi:hypothetical protein
MWTKMNAGRDGSVPLLSYPSASVMVSHTPSSHFRVHFEFSLPMLWGLDHRITFLNIDRWFVHRGPSWLPAVVEAENIYLSVRQLVIVKVGFFILFSCTFSP